MRKYLQRQLQLGYSPNLTCSFDTLGIFRKYTGRFHLPIGKPNQKLRQTHEGILPLTAGHLGMAQIPG